MSIALNFNKTEQDLTGCSKIWGCADLPEGMDYPCNIYKEDGEEYADPLGFVCQIRLEDIADLDPENRLPHTGMLYFFANMEYFLGDMDYDSPGMGPWDKQDFRVLYSPVTDNLHTHRIVDEDGKPMGLPAEALTFSECSDRNDGFKLLGKPYFDEVEEQYSDSICLLQLDEDDAFRLRFYDSGMLCFMISSEALSALRFDETQCFLHSF